MKQSLSFFFCVVIRKQHLPEAAAAQASKLGRSIPFHIISYLSRVAEKLLDVDMHADVS